MPISDAHLLKASAHVSLKVAAKSFFRRKKRQKFRIFKTIFLKQKQSTATKKFGVSLRNLALLKAPTKASFRGKKALKI